MNEDKIKLDFLDGLRGAAALFVVFFHSMVFTNTGFALVDNIILKGVQIIFRFGFLAVPVFIVLSGFCLSLSVIRNNLWFRRGFKNYLYRRTRRIVPPYYAALILSLLLIYLFSILQVPSGTAWDNKLPITTGSVVSHFLLIHNLNSDWIIKINGAMWTIATEWQIYFLFPLMLLMWKRTSYVISFIFFFIIGFLLYLTPLRIAHPHYISLFFLGVLSAYFSFKESRLIKRKILLILLIITGVIFLFFLYVNFRFNLLNIFVIETLLGLFISLLLFYMTCMLKSRRQSILVTFFSSSPLKVLGNFSYSLYLIHGPILALINLYVMKYLDLNYNENLIFMLTIGVASVTFISYLFYLLVEKRFKN